MKELYRPEMPTLRQRVMIKSGIAPESTRVIDIDSGHTVPVTRVTWTMDIRDRLSPAQCTIETLCYGTEIEAFAHISAMPLWRFIWTLAPGRFRRWRAQHLPVWGAVQRLWRRV